MFCHICGTQIEEDSVFCHKCGTKVVYEDSGGVPQKVSDSKTVPAIEDRFNVMLTKVGQEEAYTIKAVKTWTGAGLKECRELVEKVPALLKDAVTFEEAEAIKNAFRKVGAEVAFTDQKGNNAEINILCGVCGAAIDGSDNICKSCGNQSDFVQSCKITSMQNSPVAPDIDINRKKSSSGPSWKWFPGIFGIIGVIGIAVLLVWLLILFIRWIFSSIILVIIAIAVGYCIYHKGIAELITEHIYKKAPKDLQLPGGMTDSALLESLVGKFNYPYFKGIHYGDIGECVIEGKYAMYPVMFYGDEVAELGYILGNNEKKKRAVLLETMAIRDYINKFFNPALPIDVMKGIKKMKRAEGQRKAVAIVSATATVLVAAALIFDHISPGSLQSMAVPGIEVRSAYLSQYSRVVTIEEAFDNFFDNGKWTKYDSEGYTNVVFTGICEYSGERVDVRIIFKITGENFIVDSLDINGRTQSNFVLSSLLSAVYEDY